MNRQNKKYSAILQTGKELLWKHGFKKVSVEEVCQKASVSKMTFYKFFDNKTDLAKAILDEVIREGMTRFRETMEADLSPSEKMRLIIAQKMEGTNDISQEFLVDIYNSPDSELKSFMEERTRTAWTEIINDFRKAQEKGWFRNDFKPEFLLLFTQKMSELLFDEQLKQLYNHPQELILEMANFFAYGISPQK